MITKEDVLQAQNDWSNSFLEIVSLHQNNINISKATSDFIDRLYYYEIGEVLFKPTLASEIQFRKTKEGALSYFIGNNNNFSEDSGFALKSWSYIKWENSSVKIFDDIALAMGNYFFTNNEGVLKVEFSFVYKKDQNDKLRIILHDSHLPYKK